LRRADTRLDVGEKIGIANGKRGGWFAILTDGFRAKLPEPGGGSTLEQSDYEDPFDCAPIMPKPLGQILSLARRNKKGINRGFFTLW
jgi:hypothetical protein